MMSTDEQYSGKSTGSGLGQPHHAILPYKTIECSSYSAGYRAELVMEDKPTDQASRWSSASNDQSQYLVLRLDRPSLLTTITFGKFHKNHVCNMREFKVFVKSGHNTEGSWIEVLHSGLRNDSEAECFPLNYPEWSDASGFNYLPVQYVKVQPLAAWGNNFNYSIWYVELRGTNDQSMVSTVAKQYHEKLQYEAWRICLKFLREQTDVIEEFGALRRKMGIALEDPLVGQLYDMVVVKGTFTEAEATITATHRRLPALFSEFVENNVQYEPHWTRLDKMISPNGNPTVATIPIVRGGHQMCFDPTGKSIYLLGGWDGHRDLADFWRYNIDSATWTSLSEDTKKEGGPGPRSCHKVVIHTTLRRLYVLGRYIDTESRSHSNFNADFYYYDLEEHTWTRVSDDVQAQGGPGLIYDHQMAIDEEFGVIYVFGGRLITQQSPGAIPEALYSGLYSYDIKLDKWTLLRSDTELIPGTPNVKARIGHSMIFNPQTRQIYIYAGQRHKDYLCDFYVYDVDDDTVIELIKDTSRIGGPDAGFTQRSTLDVNRQELFIFSGLMREKTGNSFTSSTASNGNGQTAPASTPNPTSVSTSPSPHQPTEMAKNSFWLYRLKKRKWTRIYTNESLNDDEPCPRFAHQLVYDHTTGLHYLFGGNPGESGNPRKRLGDFWQLRLARPLSEDDILRRAIFMIRKQQFYELCLAKRRSEDPINSPSMVNAMRFLQTEVATSVDHSNPNESRDFRDLSAWLLQVPGAENNAVLDDLVRESRMCLFEKLVALLPIRMRPPARSIVNLI